MIWATHSTDGQEHLAKRNQARRQSLRFGERRHGVICAERRAGTSSEEHLKPASFRLVPRAHPSILGSRSARPRTGSAMRADLVSSAPRRAVLRCRPGVHINLEPGSNLAPGSAAHRSASHGPGPAVHRHSASKTRVNALMALHLIRGASYGRGCAASGEQCGGTPHPAPLSGDGFSAPPAQPLRCAS
jgi:hypothetical protein